MKQKVRNRKRWLGILIALAVVLTSTGILTPVTKVAASGYDPASAAAYARQWGGSRRNLAEYEDKTHKGGDCMNFVSQCLRAGGLELGGDWQPYISSWVGCGLFVNAMKARGYQVIINPTADQIYPGNLVIYQWKKDVNKSVLLRMEREERQHGSTLMSSMFFLIQSIQQSIFSSYGRR